jgi:palmitoyl transferase
VSRRIAYGALLLAFTACASVPASAQNESSPAPVQDESQKESPAPCTSGWPKWLRSNCEGARNAWNSRDWDLYLSGYIHHGTNTYSPEKLATLNSDAWGGGLGKRYSDENDRTHLLYAMAIRDSHYKPEYFAGYGWLAYWRPFDNSGLRLGGGYTAFLTLRSDYSHYYVPVPGILPLGEIAWDRVSIMASYVPRLSKNGGNGDVLFVFGRISF